MIRYELETIINYNQGEDLAEVYTCDATLIRKLDQLCEKYPTIIVTKSDEHSKTYSFPKKWVKIRPPRQLSEQMRSEMAERAKQNFGGGKSDG